MQEGKISSRYRFTHIMALAALLLAPAMALALPITVRVTTDKPAYLQGQTVKVTAHAAYSDGKPVISVDTRKVSIKDSAGVEVVKADMTNLGSGNFSYSCTLRSDARTWSWRAKVVIEDKADVEGEGTAYFTVSKSTSADTTAPVTTPSPAGGTFTAPVSVTLTASEPATIYYTSNGTTPTTSSAVYSAPIAITATATLKFFARDTAGNSEAVKSVTYTINAPPGGNPHANLTWNGPGTCLACHDGEAVEVHGSVHYQWKGDTPAIANHSGGGGKSAGAVNAYCINITGNWNGCSACHVGLGAKPTATADTAQLQNIDCLICHQKGYKRVKSNGVFVPDAANMVMSMDQAVQTVHKPTRDTCLQCHAKAGGGDAVKRGDLALAHANTSDRGFDVHMATTGANLACQACHQTSNHRIPGRGSDLRPSEGAGRVNCSTAACHATKTTSTGHATAAINSHVARVACQTCHIGTYARNAADTTATEATETFRDWQQPHLGSTGTYHPLMMLANDLKPAYAFWNGTSWVYDLSDIAAIDPKTGAYPVSRPLGAINDANSKLFPFKYKTASQPLAPLRKQLIPLDTSVYFATGNAYDAIQSGLVNMGYAAGEPYAMVTTDEFQVLNHEVLPKGQALACAACHGSTARMDLKGKLGYALKGATSTVCIQCHGYESNPGFTSVHQKHVSERRYDCSFCHNFTRPERGLRTTK